MDHFNTCSACQKNIPIERCFGNTAICQCGWTKNISQEKKYKINSTPGILIAVAVFISLSFIHIVNWNNHAVAIIPLKISQITGSANIHKLEQISAICTERKKWDCVIDANKSIYEKDSKQIEILQKLGRLYAQTNNDETSVTTYQEYFNQGGFNIDAHYEYAKALGRTGKVKESMVEYQTVLDSQPNTLQTTVTKSYVSMLIDNKMWRQAKEAITEYRKKSRSGEFFMESELKKINKLI